MLVGRYTDLPNVFQYNSLWKILAKTECIFAHYGEMEIKDLNVKKKAKKPEDTFSVFCEFWVRVGRQKCRYVEELFNEKLRFMLLSDYGNRRRTVGPNPFCLE